MPKVVRSREMTVSRDLLFRAITEFESYPSFLPEVVGVKLQPGATDAVRRVTFELEIMKRFEYTLEFHIAEKKEIAWHLIESNFFKTNEGRWLLSPLAADRTQVEYELDVAFGFLVPGWVSKKLTEINLPKMFDAFEGQAKKLAARVK